MKNGYDDPKVTSLAAARRKKGNGRTRGGDSKAPRSVRDMAIGGVFVLMALAMVVAGGLSAYQWLASVGR